MKSMKFSVMAMGVALLLTACDASNALKGGLMGGGGGAALGAGVGALIGAKKTGHTGRAAGIGAAVGAAVGSTAGALIGHKMDKAKAAAEKALADANVETVTDENGLEAIKVTFDSGILFATGKYALQSKAKTNLNKFAANVLNVYTDCDVAICGYTDSTGSDATNQTLSENRANAVKNYLLGTCGVSGAQITSTQGFGETCLIYDENGKEDLAASRRVEIYLYASKSMIEAANAGTLTY